MSSPLRRTALTILACCLTAILLFAAPSASAQNISGSIFTTFADGTTVNGNIYPSKDVVFLNGGPQNTHSAGLPDGTYYFQVTSPNGNVLLSTDDVTCRQVVVSGGIFQGNPGGTPPASCQEPAGSGTPGAFHFNGAVNPGNGGSIPIQLCAPSGCPAGAPDFNDTPNNGGEYKAWLTNINDYDPVGCVGNHGFCDNKSKTDNFKVRANEALVKVCKFNDLNDNGQQDIGEPLIAHWPITAMGVVDGPVEAQTDDNGCVAFAVDTFTNGTATVTFTETVLTGWLQTAPLDGPCTLGGTSNPADTCNVSGGVITLTVSPKDNVSAPNFGNFQQGTGLDALTVTKDANPSFTRTFKWTITKAVASTSNCTVGGNPDFCTSGSETINYTTTVNPDQGTDSGWQVTGTITIGNVNTTDISGVTVDDVVTNNGACVVDTSVFYGGGSSGTVPANGHVDLPYTCTYSSAPTPSAGTNTATAHYVLNGDPTNTSNIPATAFDFASATINGADTSVTVTDTLFAAANSGEALGTVSIDPSTLVVTTTPNAPATSSGAGIFNYSLTFKDPAGTCTTHNNTATFTTNTSGITGSANQSVTVCVGADLTVTKTANATFNSSVSKSVDKTLVEQSGGNITFNYTVTVTESGWTVSGNITVTNPNNWEDISASLSDVLSDSGGSCSISGGSPQNVPRSSSISPPYSCTFAARPTTVSGTNTATATWNGATAFTPDSSASSGPVGYTFPTLTITDNVQSSAFPGGCSATLGTVSVTTTTPNATPGCSINNLTSPSWGVFTYSITDSNSSPGTCTSFNNTAQITGGSQSGQVTVTVCNTNTGALTVGFWKNKNGQGVITNFCGGVGLVPTSLDTFLRQFNPFQDLSATATCKQDASYVANILGGATCTSTTGTCNSMLRAQMLTTALDVYFSDPTLGGNQVGLFNGLGGKTPALGGVAIDLSKICDGSDGGFSGGCPEDARPVFGVCTGTNAPVAGCGPGFLGTTVMNMLLYSDVNSCLNGSPVATSTTGSFWYLQIKGKQVLAKDAFDSINNQIAPIAPAGTQQTPWPFF